LGLGRVETKKKKLSIKKTTKPLGLSKGGHGCHVKRERKKRKTGKQKKEWVRGPPSGRSKNARGWFKDGLGGKNQREKTCASLMR